MPTTVTDDCRELVAAVDRGVPQLEREGERKIAIKLAKTNPVEESVGGQSGGVKVLESNRQRYCRGIDREARDVREDYVVENAAHIYANRTCQAPAAVYG